MKNIAWETEVWLCDTPDHHDPLRRRAIPGSEENRMKSSPLLSGSHDASASLTGYLFQARYAPSTGLGRRQAPSRSCAFH